MGATFFDSPMSDSRARVLVIGVDSADAELIERWCDEGHLPVLQSLRRQGIWARLRTTAEVMHVSAWPSLYTGMHPGKHGMYHAYQVRAGDQRVHRTNPTEYGHPPFWKYLDDAGRTCIVMDAFLNYRLEGFRGIQILEYGTWTWFAEPAASPGAVWTQIRRKFGPYPAPEHSRIVGVPEPLWFRDRLIEGARIKGEVVRWLLSEKPWDMAFVTFGEAHGGGHYLWHVSDPSYPAAPRGRVAERDCPLRDVYAAVDEAIGSIVRMLDDNTTVLVTSGDGMGPNYAGSHLVAEVLHRLGLFYSANVGRNADTHPSAKAKQSLSSRVREAIPLSVRHAITRCFPPGFRHAVNMKWVNADIDWRRSRVFCIPNANEGYLRINQKGREPEGIVDAGADSDHLIAELAQHLRALVNPMNGTAAVDRIYRIDEVFPGERRPDLPDVVVTWDSRAQVLSELQSSRCGLVRGQAAYQTSPYYSGNHRPNAFLLARGPRTAGNRTLKGGHIMDIAPSILAMLDVDPPRQMDGRVLAELVGGAPARASS